MNIIKQNADYALRAMAYLANHYDKGVISTRVISEECDITYQFTCKIMQRLNNAKLVSSLMGPKGGFFLSKDPSKITLQEVIEALQGPLIVNTCMIGPNACKRQKLCKVCDKITKLQEAMIDCLRNISLAEVVD